MTQIEKVQARIDYCTYQLELAEDALEREPSSTTYQRRANEWYDEREEWIDVLEDLQFATGYPVVKGAKHLKDYQ